MPSRGTFKKDVILSRTNNIYFMNHMMSIFILVTISVEPQRVISRCLTKRFIRSLKYTNVGQAKFIIPNSQ